MHSTRSLATVVTTTDGSIGTITLQHGPVNALSKQLIDDICAAMEQMDSEAVQVVILRAAPGAKVFSA